MINVILHFWWTFPSWTDTHTDTQTHRHTDKIYFLYSCSSQLINYNLYLNFICLLVPRLIERPPEDTTHLVPRYFICILTGLDGVPENTKTKVDGSTVRMARSMQGSLRALDFLLQHQKRS